MLKWVADCWDIIVSGGSRYKQVTGLKISVNVSNAPTYTYIYM